MIYYIPGYHSANDLKMQRYQILDNTICMSIFICPLDRRGIEVRLSRVEWSVIHKFHMLSNFIILFRIICKESRWSIYVYNTLLYCNMYMCGFGFMLLHKFKIIFSFWRRPDLNPNPKFRWGWGILTQKQYWTLTQCSNKWKRAPKLSYYIYITSLKISLKQELLFKGTEKILGMPMQIEFFKWLIMLTLTQFFHF